MIELSKIKIARWSGANTPVPAVMLNGIPVPLSPYELESVLGQALGEIEQLNNWAVFCHCCAMSGEVPAFATREEFEQYKVTGPRKVTIVTAPLGLIEAGHEAMKKAAEAKEKAGQSRYGGSLSDGCDTGV